MHHLVGTSPSEKHGLCVSVIRNMFVFSKLDCNDVWMVVSCMFDVWLLISIHISVCPKRLPHLLGIVAMAGAQYDHPLAEEVDG